MWDYSILQPLKTIKDVTREFQVICTKGKKAKFVSKNDKNAIILATFNFLHYAHAYCAYRAVHL